MSVRPLLVAGVLLVSAATPVVAQNPAAAAAGDANPLPVLDGGGPTAAITALAFGPDGRTLYSAGYDKVVRVWRRDGDTPAFRPDPRGTFRVPIGPGRDGVINVLAVSPDGAWLAASGLGVYRGSSGFGQGGWIVSADALTPEMRRERSAIYLFNTRTRAVAVLRGHEEDVLALAFAPPGAAGQPPLLVSAARAGGQAQSVGRVCVWDVGRASASAEKGEPAPGDARLHDWLAAGIGPVPGEPPPGLAVQRDPDGRCRVIVAWGDGKLRARAFGSGAAASEAEVVDEPRGGDGRPAEYAHTVVAGPGQLLTGGFVNGKGYVQAWASAAGRPPRPTTRLALVPPPGTAYALPRAMALLSSGAGRGLDHAAVVLRSPGGPGAGQEYRLTLLDMKTVQPVGAPGSISLGARATPPVVAASPDGRLLAVTGDRNREISVYAAGDLFANRPQPIRLRGVGAAVAGVAFARKGREGGLGLVLRSTDTGGAPVRSLAPQDFVLDPDQGRPTADPGRAGWAMASPVEAGWRVDRDPAAPAVFNWVGPQTHGATRLKFEPSQIVTAFTLIPPHNPRTEPLLAVATWDQKTGEPVLALYRAATGQQVRQLNGHTQPIHSLAAAPDGRLLASAADDLTVSVWGLTDVGDILGKHAGLPGVTFRPGDQATVVATVEPGLPAGLEVGDVIRSISFGGPDRKPRPVASPLDFYQAAWAETPGTTVQLGVRRGGAERPIAVRLDQATDERKPLVSLFLTRAVPPEWVAWTPLGPYDAGGREAERQLGWHFNPTRLGGPVRFALADAYRERLHKPGLLKSVLTHANLTEALKALDRPAAVPRATIWCAIDGSEPVPLGQAGAGQVLVRRPEVNLQVRVSGPSPEKNEVESVTWRVGNAEPRPILLGSAAGETLEQSLALDGPGIHRVQVRLRTREAEPQDVTRDLVVRYQPPPPRVRWDAPAEPRLIVRQAQFRLRADVEPGAPGRVVAVTLRQGGAPAKRVGRPVPNGVTVDESLTLVPGENVLELRAVNEGAPAGSEEFEAAGRTVVLVFQPVAAPVFAIASVAPLAPPGVPIPVLSGRAVTVAAGKVRVRGRVTALDPLATARVGETTLTGFRPGVAREFDFDEEVTLKPDEQDLRFRAKTADSAEAETRLTVVYRPPLPVLTLTDPDPDRSLAEGKDAPEIDVRGTLASPDGLATVDVQPFEAVVRVFNIGRPVPQEGGREAVTIPFDRLTDAGALAAKCRLLPGDNRVELTVRNRWQTTAVDRHVFYRRPPKFVGPVRPSAPGDAPVTDVSADVESATALTRVECNGRTYPVEDAAARTGPTAWRVIVRQVSLVPGVNVIRLAISNLDGPCLADGRADVSFTPPRPKSPPRVEVTNRPQGAVADTRFTARFAVHSEGSRVGRIELRRDGRVVARADPRQEQAGPDLFVATGDLGPVPLAEGANRLEVVAANDGGETAEPFTVAHLPVPEWLEIDRPPSPVPAGEFTLTGRVRWAEPTRAADVERKVRRLRVYVNDGFQQQAPAYRPAGPTGLEFEVKVVLNRTKDNVVEVVCPNLRADAGGRQRFTVDCTHPREEPLTLHLLVVAIRPGRVDATDKALALQALTALRARGGGPGLRSPVFNRVMMHPYAEDQPTPVVSGYVTCEHVRDALDSIRRHSGPNDVALVYWLGPEAVADSGDLYLLTSESRPGRKLAHAAIPLKELLAFPRESPGACVVLLDTAGDKLPAGPAVLPLPSTRVAFLRYGWSGKTAPVPGLLRALEEASRKREATSLLDLARQAGEARARFETAPAWEDNLEELPALAGLVITRKP